MLHGLAVVPGEHLSCVQINVVCGFLKNCVDICSVILLGLCMHGLQRYGKVSTNNPGGEVYTYLIMVRIAECLYQFILFTWIDSDRVILIQISGA